MQKKTNKHIWTSHVQNKMRHYNMSESLVKRTIRHPDRTEEAIVPGLVAAMKKTRSKNYPEAWVMYYPTEKKDQKIKIVTAWRYPGESPERDPVPNDVIEEVRSIIGV